MKHNFKDLFLIIINFFNIFIIAHFFGSFADRSCSSLKYSLIADNILSWLFSLSLLTSSGLVETKTKLLLSFFQFQFQYYVSYRFHIIP